MGSAKGLWITAVVLFSVLAVLAPGSGAQPADDKEASSLDASALPMAEGAADASAPQAEPAAAAENRADYSGLWQRIEGLKASVTEKRVSFQEKAAGMNPLTLSTEPVPVAQETIVPPPPVSVQAANGLDTLVGRPDRIEVRQGNRIKEWVSPRDVVVVNQPNFSWGNAQISSGPPSRRSQPNKPAVNPAAPKAPQPAEGAAPESPENTAGEPAADAESADTDAEAADAEGTEEASEESADAEDTAAKEDEGKDDTSAKDGESSDSAEAKPKKKTEKELVAEAKAAAKKDADIQVIKAMRSQNAWFYGPDGKEMTNEELDKRLETGDVAGLSAVGTIYQDRWTANSSYDPEPESESEKEAPKKR